MKKLNWEIILSNIGEAREQLEQIEARAKKGEKISEIDLQIQLEHAYHHLNFAWNIRHASTKRYANLSNKDFNRWSKFPVEIEVYKIERPEKKRKGKEKSVKTETMSSKRARSRV